MNLYELSDYLSALAHFHDLGHDFEDFAETFLMKSFTFCIRNVGFPSVYLLAISDVSHALVLYRLHELDHDELFNAISLAEKSIREFHGDDEIDILFDEDEDGEVCF